MSKLPRLLPLIAVAIGGVAVMRVAGVGPELFQGAQAWAEEAAGNVAPSLDATSQSRPPAVCALTSEQLAQQAGISPAELRIIQSLSARRGELDARDTDFATMLPLMVAAEQKLAAKVQAMNALKTELQGLVGQVSEREKAEVDRLVAVYQAMRPKEAAAVFATLDDSVRLPVAAAMRPRALAAILAQMPAPAARELTEKLARRYAAQQAAARAATAEATPAAATAPVSDKAAPAAEAPEPQAAAPAPQRAARPTPARPRPQPARTPPAEKAADETPPASGPRPYAPAQAAPANAEPPRQTVS